MVVKAAIIDSVLPFFERTISKNEARFVAKIFISCPGQISHLIGYISGDDAKLAGRVSWIVGTIWELEPHLPRLYQADLIDIVLTTRSDSVRRNLLRIIESAPLPEDSLGRLFDACLKWMKSENYAIAVRCNAMQVLYRVCCLEPGLAPELDGHIRSIQDYGSSGLKGRAKKLLRQLEKL